jgi:hypothetical protein
MARRRKVPPRRSQKLFKKTVKRTHKVNVNNRVMRGGTRL